jgi:transposase InsO family protein
VTTEDRTEAELQQLTFEQYLDYLLVHPDFEGERRHMLSDERYCLLLGFLTSAHKRVTDYGREKELDEAQVSWLQHAMGDNTYKYVVAEYTGASVSELDKGPVLVCFKEPRLAEGAKDCRRKASSTTPLTEGLARRCVPHSQIKQVLTHVHSGALGSSMHLGQKTSWERFSLLYDGVSRELVRTFVKKCPTCQQTSLRVHKAPLVRITAKTLFERVVIDLIDFERKPSCGFRYIYHAVDHYSKFHWAWAMPDKSAESVAFYTATLLADVGPIEYVQCDQGREFIAEVSTVLLDFGITRAVNSAPYHPQTNGLVERGNGLLKVALDHWFIQERSEDWYPPLARIRYQVNCNKPRTTRFTPYELVYSKKPPSWQGPLHPVTLANVMAAAEVPAAGETSAAPHTDTAASILSTMAASAPAPATVSDTAAASASAPTAAVPAPVAVAAPPPSLLNPQLPLPESQLRAEEHTVYPEFVLNCLVGKPGPLNKYMADHLNVGCHLVRLGGEGGGRCAISAFYNAVEPMAYINLTPAQRRGAYDEIRQQLRGLWEQLSTDKRKTSVAKQRRLQRMVFELGNSGSSPDDAISRPTTPEAAWAQLGADLTEATKSLGWDALALMATERQVNMLLFCCLEQVHDYASGTPQAVQHWASASDADKAAQLASTGRKRPGGRWLQQEGGTSQVLLTPFVVCDRPWVVLYQRNHMQWALRKQGDQVVTETDGGGHFEAVVKAWTTATGDERYTGLFEQGGDTESEFRQVQTLANRLEAMHNSEAASQRMAADYDNKHKPHKYKELDSVGVRIPGRNPRKGNTPNSLPGLVIKVDTYTVGTGKTASHQLYTVWTPQGVLSAKLTVDKLKPLSINSFPELLAFRDETLTAAERLPPDDPSYQSPLLGTASKERRVTLANAWTKHRATFEQRTVDMSRQRKVPARTTANAADTAIQVARADRRKGYSLGSLSNQPASQPAHQTRGSKIVRILSANKTQYTVQWSEPEGAPAISKQSIAWLDKQAEYIDVVNAWRAEQQQQQDEAQMNIDSDDGEVQFMAD